MSDDHQSDRVLDADLLANRRWVDSGGTEGAPANWSQEDLRRRDVRDAQLAEAILIGVNLSGSILDRTDLAFVSAVCAIFDASSLVDVSFLKSELMEASFVDATATKARFIKSDCADAIFARADLTGASFDQASLRGAVFTDANLRQTSWWKADLSGADLTGAQVYGARFIATMFDSSTRLARLQGLEQAEVSSIIVEQEELGEVEARAWLSARAART